MAIKKSIKWSNLDFSIESPMLGGRVDLTARSSLTPCCSLIESVSVLVAIIGMEAQIPLAARNSSKRGTRLTASIVTKVHTRNLMAGCLDIVRECLKICNATS